MFPGRRARTAVLPFIAFACFYMVVPANAHAVLLESSPAPKGTVHGPDVHIKLRFNVRIDASRSRLTLVRPDNSSQPLALVSLPSADTLLAQASNLPPGAYRLRWQVLASDGHITRGEIPFTVVQT